jgi:hypothetical protein
MFAIIGMAGWIFYLNELFNLLVLIIFGLISLIVSIVNIATETIF